MGKRKRRIAVVIAVITALLMLATGCSNSARDKAIEEVKTVKLSDYMAEDQKDVKDFKAGYVKDLEKAKDEKTVNKLEKQFKKDLKTYPTRKQKINAYKKLLLNQAGDKKSEAEKILKDYKDKLNKVKSDKQLNKLADEISQKLKNQTGTEIQIDEAAIESSTPAAKEAIKQTGQTQGKIPGKNKTTSRARTSSTASASSSAGGQKTTAQPTSSSSSSGSGRQRVWVQDSEGYNEARPIYKREPYEYYVYVVNGKEFQDYSSAYAYEDQLWDQGIVVGRWGPQKRTGYRTVTYYENIWHPATGHWETR